MGKATKNTEKRVKELRKLIHYHSVRYYTDDAPEISDEAYDSLFAELVSLETQYPELCSVDSPTHRVGDTVSVAFKKVPHKVRQWSFDNVFTHDELRAWEDRLARILEKDHVTRKSISYVAEHKIDGLKIILEYEKGVFVRATTRGDGEVGEDVTHSARMVRDIPSKLTAPLSLIVVGEAWLSENVFEKINHERQMADEPLFANPRNAAAGSIRQLDPEVTKKRNLSYFAYDIDAFTPLPKYVRPDTQQGELELLKQLGFRVNKEYLFAETLDKVFSYYEKWSPKRQKMEYGIDGIVVKVNEVRQQVLLGYTAKAPRFGIAYKFPAEQATTIIEDIVLQVGRTGVITPVAHLRPTLIAGSTVSRATLHNEDQIKRLDLRIGDTVVLQKAGDVIPEIVSVVRELRPKNAKSWVFPTHVSECGGDGRIERIPGESAYRCVNKDSDVLHRRRLYYFTSKHGMNMDGVGEKTIDLLLDHNLINSAVDLFTLTKGDLLGLPGFKDKSAENTIDAINSVRTVPLNQFLTALGIEHVGEETARIIAEAFPTIISIRDASRESLIAVHGVGEIVADSLYTWLRTKEHKAFLDALLKEVTPKKQEATRSTVLAGKTFVFTGTLDTLGRTEAERLARTHGAQVTSSVSKKTDYAVVGRDPGSNAKKARELGVTILDEEGFRALIQ